MRNNKKANLQQPWGTLSCSIRLVLEDCTNIQVGVGLRLFNMNSWDVDCKKK